MLYKSVVGIGHESYGFVLSDSFSRDEGRSYIFIS